MEDRIPCPFCGGLNLDYKTYKKEDEKELIWVHCYDCGASGGMRENEEAADKAWENRVEIAQSTPNEEDEALNFIKKIDRPAVVLGVSFGIAGIWGLLQIL